MADNLFFDMDKNNMSNPIYNTQELATLLKVSTRTIQRWRDSGMIQFSAIGSKYYYTHADVFQMLNKNKIKND